MRILIGAIGRLPSKESRLTKQAICNLFLCKPSCNQRLISAIEGPDIYLNTVEFDLQQDDYLDDTVDNATLISPSARRRRLTGDCVMVVGSNASILRTISCIDGLQPRFRGLELMMLL